LFDYDVRTLPRLIRTYPDDNPTDRFQH
jgi:hypothetical protein